MKKYASVIIKLILSLVSLALIGAVAAAVIINRDDLTPQNVAHTLFPNRVKIETADTFYYSANDDAMFASLGGGFAVSSSEGLHVFDQNGEETVFRLAPASGRQLLASRGEYAAAYSVGGRLVRLLTQDGIKSEFTTENNIICASVSSSGHTAVCTEETTGYNGSVTVYKKSGEDVFKWYSGEGYITSARVSDDGKSVYIVTLSEKGGSLIRYELSSDKETFRLTLPDEVILDAHISDESVTAITASRIITVSANGEVTASCDLGGVLRDYAFGNGFTAAVVSDYRTDTRCRIVTADGSGNIINTLVSNSVPSSVSASGEYLAVLSAGSASVYDMSLARLGGESAVSALSVIMREDGTCIAAGAYSASVFGLGGEEAGE